MTSRYTHGDLTWIDLETPTQEEVRTLMKEFAIDPLVAEELLTPTLKPKVDLLPNYIYLILHFPSTKENESISKNREIDFVIGKDFIITVRYDTIDPLHEFSKVFEVHSILDREDMGTHSGYVFFYMVRRLYKAVANEIAYIGDSLKDIEERVFRGEERRMVYNISKISKDLLNFKRTIGTHHEVLNSFEIASEQFFGKNFAYHSKSITGEFYRVHNEIEASLDILHELRDTNNSLVSTNQNEIMKVLTIMAFVTFPLSLFASVFGMNTQYLPIVGHPLDFWIILTIMGAMTAFFFVFFKYKKWL